MTDLARAEVETLLGTIADMQRRLDDLERAQMLLGSIPRGYSISVVDPVDGSPIAIIGTLVDGVSVGAEFYDASGDIVARFGNLDSGTRNGAEVYNAAGIRILRADERGALEPNVYVPFATIQDTSVTSGTFTSIYRGRIPKMKCPYLHLEFDADCDGGTTAEARLTIFRTPGGTQTSAVKSIPSGALATYHLYIQVDMVLDGRASMVFETRRVSGAGAIRASTPFVDLGDYSATATTGGVWT